MAEEKLVHTVDTDQKQNAAANSHLNGPLLERRFIVYERVKLSVKSLDIIIAVCTLMLIAAFILGIYKR